MLFVSFGLSSALPIYLEWNSVVVQVPTRPTVDAGTCVYPEWNSVVVQVPTGPTVDAGTCVCPEWNSVVVQVPTKPRVHVYMSHCSQRVAL